MPKGITAFLVEAGTPGFRFGAREHKMGIRACPASELIFDECEVPAANRLGEEGGGYRIALSALGEGRVSIAAACVGLARSGLEAAARYLGEREAFGGPLSAQQGLRFMLAEMARDVAAARALTHAAASARDRGEPLAEARRWPSGPRPTRRCASPPTPSSCSGPAATRARPASSA